jgi:hypothetical protein
VPFKLGTLLNKDEALPLLGENRGQRHRDGIITRCHGHKQIRRHAWPDLFVGVGDHNAHRVAFNPVFHGGLWRDPLQDSIHRQPRNRIDLNFDLLASEASNQRTTGATESDR